VTIYLNTDDLCSEAHHCAKSTLGKLENWLAIVGSDAKFWDLVAIPKYLSHPFLLLRG
jgi:hypothetical protein